MRKQLTRALKVHLTVLFLLFLPFLATESLYAQEPPATPLKTVPNIFTPNGDGINDLVTLETEGKIDFWVYNRNGGLVYHASGKKIIWDGTNQRGYKLADGLYYYVLNDTDQGYEKSRGFIYIARENQKTPENAGQAQ